MISALPQQYKGPINSGFSESETSNFHQQNLGFNSDFYRRKDLFSSCENFKLLDSARLAQVQHRSSKWQTIFSLDEIDPDQIKISVKGQYLIISSQKKSNIPDMTKVLNQLFYTMTNLPSSPWSKKILIPDSVKRSTIRSRFNELPRVNTLWSTQHRPYFLDSELRSV